LKAAPVPKIRSGPEEFFNQTRQISQIEMAGGCKDRIDAAGAQPTVAEAKNFHILPKAYIS
jgi:hypothetical protein